MKGNVLTVGPQVDINKRMNEEEKRREDGSKHSNVQEEGWVRLGYGGKNDHG